MKARLRSILTAAALALSGCVAIDIATPEFKADVAVTQAVSMAVITGDAIAAVANCPAIADHAPGYSQQLQPLSTAANKTAAKVQSLKVAMGQATQQVAAIDKAIARLQEEKSEENAAYQGTSTICHPGLGCLTLNDAEKQLMVTWAYKMRGVVTGFVAAFTDAGLPLPSGLVSKANAALNAILSLENLLASDAANDLAVSDRDISRAYFDAGDAIDAARPSISALQAQRASILAAAASGQSFGALEDEAAQEVEDMQQLYEQIVQDLESHGCTVPPLSDTDLNTTLWSNAS